MMMTFFAEHYGYCFDQDLMSRSAGYVRNALVLASLGEHSEYEHFEKILNDAICEKVSDSSADCVAEGTINCEKYQRYYTDDYKPVPHEYVDIN